MAQKGGFWISYDLGVSGPYDEMYAWLDKHNAKECGDSFAVINNYQFDRDLRNALRQDLQNTVHIRENDRIYVICRRAYINPDDKRESSIGFFVFGSRKDSAPWEGWDSAKKEDTPPDEEI